MKLLVAGQLASIYLYFFTILLPLLSGEPLLVTMEGRGFAVLALAGLLNIAFAAGNIACGLKRGGSLPAALVLKVLAIPMFCTNAYFGVICTVFGMFFAVTLPLALLTVVTACAVLLSSSCYLVPLALAARREKRIGTAACVLHTAAQFLFVFDVIGAAVFALQSRAWKTGGPAENGGSA
ncbi:hypothetical protein LI291_08905 [Intestinibacillus massiliensis]|nr:hypothetical protein [Intestinibacillus massiliensis]